MFTTLNKFETDRLFKKASIFLNNNNNNNNEYTLTIEDNNKEVGLCYDMLSFKKTFSQTIVCITNLKKIDNDLSSLHDIYLAVCKKALDKFIVMTKTQNKERLWISTEDPFIHELMLEKNFKLVGKNMATKELKGELKV